MQELKMMQKANASLLNKLHEHIMKLNDEVDALRIENNSLKKEVAQLRSTVKLDGKDSKTNMDTTRTMIKANSATLRAEINSLRLDLNTSLNDLKSNNAEMRDENRGQIRERIRLNASNRAYVYEIENERFEEVRLNILEPFAGWKIKAMKRGDPRIDKMMKSYSREKWIHQMNMALIGAYYTAKKRALEVERKKQNEEYIKKTYDNAGNVLIGQNEGIYKNGVCEGQKNHYAILFSKNGPALHHLETMALSYYSLEKKKKKCVLHGSIFMSFYPH
eukprot:72563_1